MTVPWGGTETAEERAYFDPDPDRHVTPEARATADADWRRTLAALDRDGGVAIYERMDFDEWPEEVPYGYED